MEETEEIIDESFFTGEKKEPEENSNDYIKQIRNTYNDKQIGSIAKYVEPVNGSLPIEDLLEMFKENPNLDVVPIEEYDRVVGVIDRKTVAASTNTIWKKITSKDVINYMQRISNVVLYAQDFIEKAITKISEINKQFGTFYFPVFEGKSFYGIVSIDSFLSRISEIREKDLEKASLIQRDFFPNQNDYSTFPYTITSWNKMANALGGDFYQVYKISSTKSMVCCFDVSGKNVAASLLTIAIGTFFKMLALNNKDISDPSKIVIMLDEYLNNSIPAGNFITAVFCVVDTSTNDILLYNCGHTLVYYLFKNAKEASSGKIATIKPLMPPLGMGKVAELLTNPNGAKLFSTLKLQNGAHLDLYTDGFTDMKNNYSQSFGDSQAKQFFVKLYDVKQNEISSTIEKTISTWIQDAMLPDDITVIDIRF